ncbi:MAG: hypothetical protein ABSG04_14755 [Verrucomicrobiota bacterium]
MKLEIEKGEAHVALKEKSDEWLDLAPALSSIRLRRAFRLR